MCNTHVLAYPGSSVGEESACSAGDPGLIPDAGIKPGSPALQADSLPTEL